MRVARLVLPLFVMIGCGGASKAPVAKPPDPIKDPIPTTAGPPCNKVGEHMAMISLAGKVDTDERVAKSFTKRCSTDGWSDEVRSCFAAIENDAESEGCVGKLTEAQKKALVDVVQSDASMAPPPSGGAPAPAPAAAPPPRTRGPVKKDPPKDDPCQGGE